MPIDSLPHLAGIYLITCMANGRTYVGSSQNIYERLREHLGDLINNKHNNSHLQNAWNKYGALTFQSITLELCVKSQLLEREAYWFKQYHVGDKSKSFNIAIDPASPTRGRKHSPETIIKMKAAAKGRVLSEQTKRKISEVQIGKRLSDEHKKNIGLSGIGKVMSEESKRKISIANKGKKRSDEARARMSAGGKGKILSSEHIQNRTNAQAKTYSVTSPEGVEMIIKNLNKFCRENGLGSAAMCDVASGRHPSHKGWKCRRILNT